MIQLLRTTPWHTNNSQSLHEDNETCSDVEASSGARGRGWRRQLCVGTYKSMVGRESVARHGTTRVGPVSPRTGKRLWTPPRRAVGRKTPTPPEPALALVTTGLLLKYTSPPIPPPLSWEYVPCKKADDTLYEEERRFLFCTWKFEARKMEVEVSFQVLFNVIWTTFFYFHICIFNIIKQNSIKRFMQSIYLCFIISIKENRWDYSFLFHRKN